MADPLLTDADYGDRAVEGTVYFDSNFQAFHLSISDQSAMVSILRRADESFQQAIRRVHQATPLRVAINGMWFDFGFLAGASAVLTNPVDPEDVEAEGIVRATDGSVLRGRSAPDMFHVNGSARCGISSSEGKELIANLKRNDLPDER